MYHNILVPISFDEERDVGGPLKLARLLANDGAKITLLHVVEHVPSYALTYMPPDYLKATREGIQAGRNRAGRQRRSDRGAFRSQHPGLGAGT